MWQHFLGFTNKSIHSSLTASSRNPDPPTAKPLCLLSSLSFLQGLSLPCPPLRSLLCHRSRTDLVLP